VSDSDLVFFYVFIVCYLSQSYIVCLCDESTVIMTLICLTATFYSHV